MRNFYLFLFLVIYNASHAQLVINEYSCANRNTITDNFGEYEDWIELYNSSGAAMDISGYFLSDDAANPTKWQLPAATNINANGFVLFWASGRNISTGLAFHTSFKLTQTTTEKIILSNTLGVIIDSLTIRPNQVDNSRGRFPNGSGTWQVFTNPTPGVNNTAGFTDYAETPTLSLQAGVYPNAQVLTINVSDAAATIRYTTNGADPTGTSTQYAGPINITANTIIKAACFPANAAFRPSFIETNTYLIGVSHTMPIVCLGSDNYNNLFNNQMPEIVASCEYFNSAGVFQFEAVGESDPHGNDSWAYPQKGVDFVVRDQYGYDNDIDYQLFPTKPRTKFQRFMLKAGASDNYPFTGGSGGGCHLRDAFIQSLAEKANLNVDLRSNDHCVVYINGQYWGLYEMREKVGDPDYTNYYWGQKEEDLDFLQYWGGMNVQYGNTNDWDNLYAYIMANDLSVTANYNAVAARYDIASAIDYIILNTWSVNSDWINWNTMWWRGTGTPAVKWKYALWDMDNTFNLGQNFSGWPTTGFTADPCALDDNFENAGPNEGHLDMFNRLMANPEFKQRYVNRYAQLINTSLSCDYALAHLDSIINHITPEMPEQIARWGGSMAEWQSHLDFIRAQITGRCQYIENNGVVNCYEVDGPHELAFNVAPAGAGTIRFNELQIPQYPWSGAYFGGVNGEIEATPSNSTYEFWYWEVFHHNLLSDSTEILNEFLISGADSIVAHFRIIQTHQITYIIDPAAGGSVSINGITPGTFPFTATYNEGTPITLTATADPNYNFLNYSATYHTFTPDAANTLVVIQVDTTDTVIVHFQPKQTWDLTVIVEPKNAGNVVLNGEYINVYPKTYTYFPGQEVNVEALPYTDYLFSHWSLDFIQLQADTADSLNTFIVDTTDTLVAHFKLKEVIPQTVYMPSSFTPNGDNLNDFFEVFHSETVTLGNVKVYDRWGQEMYRSESLDAKWDGKISGKPVMSGMYYFVVNYYLKDKYFETLQGPLLIYR